MDDFKAATDVLTGAPSYPLNRLATVFGVERNSVDRWRATGDHRRTPRQDWPATVAAEAKRHAEELREHAARLDRLASELRT